MKAAANNGSIFVRKCIKGSPESLQHEQLSAPGGALNAIMHVPFLALAEQEEIENASATCVRKLGWGVQEAFEAKRLHPVRGPPQVVSPQRQCGKKAPSHRASQLQAIP